jgi:hypothetical protein
MDSWRNLTMGQMIERAARYKPFIAFVAALAFVGIVVPGTRTVEPGEDLTAGGPAVTESTTAVTTPDAAGAGATDQGAADPAAATAGAGGSATASRGGAGGAGGAGQRAAAGPGRTAPAVQTGGNAMDAPDCDKTTGRIAIPSFYAPNCVPLWDKTADNGGSTWQGVTKDTVKIAIYIAQQNEQTAAILAAAGAGDDTSDAEDDENRNLMLEAYQAHFETYGRKIEYVKVQATGAEDDDAAANADALKVAKEIKAFASWGAPTGTNAYVDTLVANKVMCLSCTVSQPQESYDRWSPYVWSDLMASTQGYIHRAEYVGKKLWGKNAVHAGSPVMQQQKRTFALVYYETEDGAFKAGADFMERELAKYGAKLTDRIAVTGAHLNPTRAQNESRTVAARLKEKGITSVLFAGDPLYPIFLTNSATEQQYFPEWIITGSALTDTTFFARTYNPQQWSNAFGISYLTARIDPAVSDAEGNLVSWHHGRALTSYPSALAMNTTFTGMHLAGPNLTPQTFRDGMFSFKPTSGYITRFAVSFGTHLWPWPDHLAADDAAEIWWDPAAQGPDELENEAAGMYRYVDMGKRYLPGQWPAGDPKVFATENTVTMYSERPPQDRFPEYPRRPGFRK